MRWAAQEMSPLDYYGPPHTLAGVREELAELRLKFHDAMRLTAADFDLAEREENEACALIAEAWAKEAAYSGERSVLQKVAKAIRARK